MKKADKSDPVDLPDFEIDEEFKPNEPPPKVPIHQLFGFADRFVLNFIFLLMIFLELTKY
jgi:hypothetical protein